MLTQLWSPVPDCATAQQLQLALSQQGGNLSRPYSRPERYIPDTKKSSLIDKMSFVP